MSEKFQGREGRKLKRLDDYLELLSSDVAQCGACTTIEGVDCVCHRSKVDGFTACGNWERASE